MIIKLTHFIFSIIYWMHLLYIYLYLNIVAFELSKNSYTPTKLKISFRNKLTKARFLCFLSFVNIIKFVTSVPSSNPRINLFSFLIRKTTIPIICALVIKYLFLKTKILFCFVRYCSFQIIHTAISKKFWTI